jgi:hypothetical protein
MAPPKTGRTPDTLRTARSLELLREGGGDRIAVRLQAEGVSDLQKVMAANGFTEKSVAVAHALRLAAKKLR